MYIPDDFRMVQTKSIEHLTNSGYSAISLWRHNWLLCEELLYKVLNTKLAWLRFINREMLLSVDKLRWSVTQSSEKIEVVLFTYAINNGSVSVQFVSVRNCSHGAVSDDSS